MEQESLELKKHISERPDEELLEMVMAKSNEYREEAVNFAKAELTARGIDFTAPADDQAPEDTPSMDLSSASPLPGSPSVCSMCAGTLRQGTLVAEKELTVIFDD